MPIQELFVSTTATPAVKILSDDGSSLRVGGYGVVFHGKDVVGDTFLPTTDLWLDKLSPTPPVLFDHGGDPTLKRAVVGRVESTKPDDLGLWVEAKITANRKYREAISRLVKEGVLGWSSGAVGHLVERAKNGVLHSWAIAEFSLTPTPAEPRTLGVRQIKSLAAFDTKIAELIDDDSLIDAREPDTKAVLDTAARDNLSSSDFAYIDSDGGRHLPINDAGHVRAAMSRFNQTHFESDAKRKAAARKIQARARSLGIDLSADSAVAQAAKGGPQLEDETQEQEQPQLRGAAAKIAEFRDRLGTIAEKAEGDTVAFERFGTDTKDAHRFHRATLDDFKKVRDEMNHLIEWAESIDEGEDGIRRVNFYKHQLALIGLEAAS